MKHSCLFLVILGMAAVTCFPLVSAAEIGGDQGWYVIHCNVYGANAYLDDKFVGTVPQGALTVPVPITGPPYKMLRVQKSGYATYASSITEVPVKGGSVDLYATLNELPATTPHKSYTVKKDGYTTFEGTASRVLLKEESIDLSVATVTATPTGVGGDIEGYNVHSNIDGAMVKFDNDVKGKIANGVLAVQVFVTGTPYRAFTVYKSGYVPYTGTIGQYPAKGQTVDLYATLNAEAETAAPPPVSTTRSSLPPVIAGIALIFGGIFVMHQVKNRK